MNLKDYQAKVEELKNEVKRDVEREGKKMLAEGFLEFFTENPQVESVRWNQYTPYFNDGDPCIFGRGDMSISLVEEPEDFMCSWDYSKDDPMRKVLDELDEKFGSSQLDELFEMTFGDGVEVTATRNGFDVEEYSHD